MNTVTPASKPKIYKLWASGGCTDWSDYLMTDGTIKTFVVSKLAGDDFANEQERAAAKPLLLARHLIWEPRF